MIRNRRAGEGTDNGSDAITRILRAEQEAELALEEARRQGAELGARARRQAVEIHQRADDRVTRLNVLCREKTAERIEALRAAEREQEAASERPVAEETLDAAARAVADWLLGGSEP